MMPFGFYWLRTLKIWLHCESAKLNQRLDSNNSLRGLERVGSYRIEIKRSAGKELRKINNKQDRQRIVDRIAALAEDPRPAGSQKLSGQEAYSVRQGVYRIVYTIEDDVLIVTIIKVGHRRDV